MGEPALELLRQAAAASQDPEARRRLQSLVQTIADKKWHEWFQQALHQEKEAKDYAKAAERFEELARRAVERWRSEPRGSGNEGDPFLSEVYVHLARCYRELKDYAKAANGYRDAVYYAGNNPDRRTLLDGELSAMIANLISAWEKQVRDQLEQEPTQKALAAKYPLVVLHSRRLAGGGYGQSAYSFIYETADQAKHHNDVQLLFENGNRDSTFCLNMVVGQQNLIADLGPVTFDKDPDPKKVDIDSEHTWVPGFCKAVPGRVYLERVRDPNGNRFYVVFQVLAVGEASDYVAFIWRRLPGGKVVPRP
jgi:hypothetical protein